MNEHDRCEQAARLVDRVFGELDASSQAALEAHLATCASCAGEDARLRALHAAASVKPAPLPAVVRERIVAAARGATPRRAWLLRPVPAYALLLAALFGAALVVLWPSRPSRPSVPAVDAPEALSPAPVFAPGPEGFSIAHSWETRVAGSSDSL